MDEERLCNSNAVAAGMFRWIRNGLIPLITAQVSDSV